MKKMYTVIKKGDLKEVMAAIAYIDMLRKKKVKYEINLTDFDEVEARIHFRNLQDAEAFLGLGL